MTTATYTWFYFKDKRLVIQVRTHLRLTYTVILTESLLCCCWIWNNPYVHTIGMILNWLLIKDRVQFY